MTAVFMRLVIELSCIIGLICAAVLAYADKSWWVWGWFLFFAFLNITYSRSK